MSTLCLLLPLASSSDLSFRDFSPRFYLSPASISPWLPPFLRLTLWQRLNLAAAVAARSPVTNTPGCAAWGATRWCIATYAFFSLRRWGPLYGTPSFPTRGYAFLRMAPLIEHRRLSPSLFLFLNALLHTRDRLISPTPLTIAKTYICTCAS